MSPYVLCWAIKLQIGIISWLKQPTSLEILPEITDFWHADFICRATFCALSWAEIHTNIALRRVTFRAPSRAEIHTTIAQKKKCALWSYEQKRYGKLQTTLYIEVCHHIELFRCLALCRCVIFFIFILNWSTSDYTFLVS